MQHHRQHSACMEGLCKCVLGGFGLGLSCGPGSGQLGSESVLSGVEAWMVPYSGTSRSLKTSLGPGEAQERPS